MATPIADPNKQPTDSGENTNPEFEKVYEKINVDEIDTSGLEIATTMDATNAALLEQVEKNVNTTPKNAIPEIGDIAAYIAATKEATKEKEKLPAQLLAMDGTDLSKLPGAYAIVPHQKGDHKVVFLRSQAPAELINDPKNRTKGSVYQKDGADIYKVSVDMKQHTTLRNTEGKPLDVWIIDDPKDLDDQIQSIYSGKGGGTNFGMPVKVTSSNKDKATKEPTPAKQPEVKKDKKIEPKIVEVAAPKETAPKPPAEPTVEEKKEPLPTTDVEKNKDTKKQESSTNTKIEPKEEDKKDLKDTAPVAPVKKEQKPKPTEKEAQTSMDDARKAMKEKMHTPAASPVKKEEVKVATPIVAPTVPVAKAEPVAKTEPVSKAPASTPAIATTTPEAKQKETPAKTIPVEKAPPVKAAPVENITPVVKPISTLKVETPVVPSATEKKPVVEKIVTPLPPAPPVENKTPETISLEPPYEQPAPSFPVFNIDTLSAPTPKPSAPSTPVETLVGQKSLDAEPSKAPDEKAPKTLEQMLEQQAKPTLQDVLSTSKSAPVFVAKKTPTPARKPLLALSKKQRLGILIVLVLIVGWIGWVMFGNNGGTAPTDQPNDQVDGGTENPTPTPDGEANPDGEENPDDTENPDNEQPKPEDEIPVDDPEPTDDEPKTTFTMAELVAKLESIQVEARKTVNEARKVSNREAIKFSVAALQKATSTLENVETDTKLTADQVQQDATRAEKYLQDALTLLEDNAN